MTTAEVDNGEIVRPTNEEVGGGGQRIDRCVADDYAKHDTVSPEEIREREGNNETRPSRGKTARLTGVRGYARHGNTV